MSLTELREALKSTSLTFGSKEAIRHLKSGTVKKIFLSSDCPEHIRKDIIHFSRFNNVPIVDLTQPSDELSLICKKNFLINVISC